MNCPDCKNIIPDHSRTCKVCEYDAGFPNKRAAEKPIEQTALDKRYTDALLDGEKRGCKDNILQFQEEIKKSKAVLCRSLSKIQEFVSSDNELYATFYQLVSAGAKIPEKNKYDPIRPIVDGMLFPYYHEQIRFAALTLNNSGAKGFGNCSIILKDDTINRRTTVFEENSIHFAQKKRLVATEPVPAGYRATWEHRDLLAAAKQADKIDNNTKACDFPGILLNSIGSKSDDFIEVHIYGSISRQGVESLIVKKPKKKADRVILKSIKNKLKQIGVGVEEIL
ncbi:MAG: hypothetical protein GY839_17865 [candidate division Zixibacteria bacterium]|nr:hypothetical protein [candidate division Zixibacteria bacterium]